MDDGGIEVVDAVQAHVQRQQVADQNLIGKDNERLHDVEGVAAEGRGHSRPAGGVRMGGVGWGFLGGCLGKHTESVHYYSEGNSRRWQWEQGSCNGWVSGGWVGGWVELPAERGFGLVGWGSEQQEAGLPAVVHSQNASRHLPTLPHLPTPRRPTPRRCPPHVFPPHTAQPTAIQQSPIHAGAHSLVVDGVHVLVQWAPVQQAVAPVEPGVMQVVQRHN